MRTLYLIRHGHPDFPLGAHMCLGRTDTPLGPLGRMQAALLGLELEGKDLSAVYCSPLTRCRETAAPLGKPLRLLEALREQDMGLWDGLDFDAIRRGWPELYARRSAEPLLVPPGAETLEQVFRRVLPALDACVRETEEDIAVVAHASVIQAILARITDTPLSDSRPLRPPYTGRAEIALGDDGPRLLRRDALPELPLTPTVAEALLRAAAPGQRAEKHCRAVAREALRLADALPLELDRALLESAALLHDAARPYPCHAIEGAAWLRALGYERAAALVERHHDYSGGELDEAALLYLADKCVREDRAVSLAERFAESEKRCQSDEARAAHRRRYEAALDLKNQINRLCGREIVS